MNFICQQISLQDDKELLQKLTSLVTTEQIDGECNRDRAERENAWLIIIPLMENYTSAEQIQLSSNAQCWHVLEHFLVKEELYERIFECYLPTAIRHDELFTYIDNNAAVPKMKIYDQIHLHILELLEIDASQTVRLIVDNFYEKFEDFVRILSENRRSLYLFLKISLSLGITLSSQFSETYLQLLGDYEPSAILPFLESSDNYRIEKALDIVTKLTNFAGKSQCTIFLLEKQGDYQKAFDLSIKQLKEFDDVEGSLKVAAFCSRAVKALEEEGTEFWFRFLEIILSRGEYRVVKKKILHEAKKYVNLVKLVQLVMDSGTESDNFGDIKDLLLGMLASSELETKSLESVVKIIQKDSHTKFDSKKKKSDRGLLVTAVRCVECRQKLYSSDSDIFVVGKCGHAIHEKCSTDTLKCTFCNSSATEENAEEPVELSTPKVDLFDKEQFLNYSFF